ncbi:MAG: hypothetical protein R1F52_03320 [Candidatus Nitrosoabyssus spongiisocia]|nr:MAG: hypothetical protein R1F52_03320 [Nitrosopumilaceae archaeon AB1(1)]
MNQRTKLEDLQKDLTCIKTKLKTTENTKIPRKNIKEDCRVISWRWSDEIQPSLTDYLQNVDSVDECTKLFTMLLETCSSHARVKTYVNIISKILKILKNKLIPAIFNTTSNQIRQLDISENITKKEEDYFGEAKTCYKWNCYRASILLGWNATISRIQITIKNRGFEEFNTKSTTMHETKSGRYKKFTKSFNVQNIAGLQVIPDSDILQVLEFGDLIDSSQFDRLKSCLKTRNNVAHPGKATVTEHNILSFYSDIKSNIFDNENFDINNSENVT